MNKDKKQIISAAFPELAQQIKQQETNDLLKSLIDNMQEMKNAKVIPVLKGDTGIQGDRGSSFLGCVDTVADLPEVDDVNDGDYIYVLEDGGLYHCSFEEWQFIDTLKGVDGYTPVAGVDFQVPDEDEILNRLLRYIPDPIPGEPGKDGVNGKDGSPDTAEQIVEKINTLKDVIEPSVIKGYESSDDVIKKIKKQKLELKDINGMPLNMNDLRWHGGGISNITGLVTAGANITVTGSGTATDPYVIIGTAGGGFTELPATGAVDGSNVTYTFTAVPSYIVADGIWLKPTGNNSPATVFWTNVGLTVTMVNPPSQSIWGVA